MERDTRRHLSKLANMQRFLALACLAAAFAFSACARVAGHGDYVIRGSLVDAETGAPVAHHGLNLIASHEAHDPKLSIERQHRNRFEVRAPTPMVRLRVADSTDRYELHEEQLWVPQEGLEHVVRLVPTHFVLLKARVVVNEGGAWVLRPPHIEVAGPNGMPIISGTPHMYFSVERDAEVTVDGAPKLRPAPEWRSDACYDSTFELRVPRKRLHMSVINSELVPNDPILDLSGVTGDVVEREIRFVKYH